MLQYFYGFMQTKELCVLQFCLRRLLTADHIKCCGGLVRFENKAYVWRLYCLVRRKYFVSLVSFALQYLVLILKSHGLNCIVLFHSLINAAGNISKIR
jgi:hypothetical protein